MKIDRMLILSATASILAVALNPSAHAEDARVLPVGRSRLSFIYAQTDGITQQFDDHGVRTSIAQPYNLAVNAENVKKVSPDFARLVDGLNKSPYRYNPQARNPYNGVTLGSDGIPLGDAVSRGFLGVGATAHETQYNVSYQYGMTDRLSVGFLVPIIKAQISLDASLTGNNTAQDIQSAFNRQGMGSPLDSTIATSLAELANLNVPTIQSLLKDQGYNVPMTTNQSGIGDVVLGGRYNYYKSRYEDVISSAQAGVSLPTGALRDPTEPTQIDLGSGAFDLGVAHIVNYSPLRFLTLSNGIHYDHRLPAHRNLIVPDSAGGELIPPTSNEENVSMQLGDKYWTNLGTSFKLTDSLTLSAQYEWFWKRPDTYQGSRTDRNYSALSANTRQYLETLQLGASLSTIPAFLKKDFPLPTDVAFNVYIPRSGVNAVIAPYGTAELALYF